MTAALVATRQETAGPRLGTRMVLVADDTAFVRDRFKAAIEGAGHQALVARSGPELLALMRTNTGGLHLVVVDLRLPQARGVELVREVRRIDPAAAVVVFSGTIAHASEVRQLATLGVAGYINEYAAVPHIMPSLAPHLFPDQYNRRSSPRVLAGIGVSYRFGNTIAAALTLNISRGGLAVRTTSPLEVGTPVRVRFRVPTSRKEVDAEARVAWVDRRVGMGLQFTKLDPADDAAVHEFVQSHFFSNRKA